MYLFNVSFCTININNINNIINTYVCVLYFLHKQRYFLSIYISINVYISKYIACLCIMEVFFNLVKYIYLIIRYICMSVCLYVSLSIYMPIYLSRICNNQYMSSRIGSPARASCPACPLSYQDCHKETLSESETYKSKLRST